MQEVNKKLVLIQSIELDINGKLESSEISREQEMKKQNRGTVIMVGNEVDWPSTGDVISYFRGAATDITDDDGTEYQLVNAAHVLAKF